MSRIQSNQIQSAIANSLADKNLDKNEFQQLQQMVQESSELSPEAKGKVMEFLQEARSDSAGFFFGIFGAGVSDREMTALKSLAQSAGLGELAQQLEQQHPTAQPQRSNADSQHQNGVQSRQSADFNPISNFFSNLFGGGNRSSATQSADSTTATAAPQRGRRTTGNFDFNRSYVTQNGNGLASGGGDCGPAAAAMVAKHFGFLEGVSNRDAVQTARNHSGVTSARDGAWAITDNEFFSSVSSMTGGAVRQSGYESFDATRGQRDSLVNSIRNRLAQGELPVLETGSPYRNESGQTGRHYMVVMGVNDDGSLVLADPGGKRQWTMSPDRLLTEMQQASRTAGTKLLSFAG